MHLSKFCSSFDVYSQKISRRPRSSQCCRSSAGRHLPGVRYVSSSIRGGKIPGLGLAIHKQALHYDKDLLLVRPTITSMIHAHALF